MVLSQLETGVQCRTAGSPEGSHVHNTKTEQDKQGESQTEKNSRETAGGMTMTMTMNCLCFHVTMDESNASGNFTPALCLHPFLGEAITLIFVQSFLTSG